MTTRTHNADRTAEIDLPTQRYELRDTNRSGWHPHYELVPLDYSPSADDPDAWCRAEDVAKLEDSDIAWGMKYRGLYDENDRLRAEVARLNAQCDEAMHWLAEVWRELDSEYGKDQWDGALLKMPDELRALVEARRAAKRATP